jgi:photosystem II stability/assembly factor-like uncharacterized protein
MIKNGIRQLTQHFPLRLSGWAVICLIFASVTFAQLRGGQGWAWQNPLPQGNPLNSIHFAKDKLSGFAVGSDNTILRTQDGGFTWQRQALLHDLTLSSVFVKDKKNAVIVGARGSIFSTDNGGHDWRAVSSDARDHLYAVTFAGETGWATGRSSHRRRRSRRRCSATRARCWSG